MIFVASRTIVIEAKLLHERVEVVRVNASAETRYARLVARGREGHSEIVRRLMREEQMGGDVSYDSVVDNDGALEVAIAQFLAIAEGSLHT